MPKTQDLLLILSSEERDAAEDFIQRKLKLLDAEALPQLELIGSSARTILEQIGRDSAKFNTSSKTGKVLAKIYRSAQEGLAHLIRECNLAASQKQRESGDEASAEGADDQEELDKLRVAVDEEDEEYALSVIESSIADMNTQQIRELRDSTEEILTWWQTDGGMHESLHINQWGDINTANGRMAIRKVREEFQREEIAPFRGFFQQINLIHQKKNQEARRISRQERLRQEAGLTE